MKQGVLLPSRVRLLLSKGHSCYRPRRTGERKRKSVRGCIVGSDMSVLSVTIVKQGEQDLPGLTDTTVPKRLGPKRANNIRKFFVRNDMCFLYIFFFGDRTLGSRTTLSETVFYVFLSTVEFMQWHGEAMRQLWLFSPQHTFWMSPLRDSAVQTAGRTSVPSVLLALTNLPYVAILCSCLLGS